MKLLRRTAVLGAVALALVGCQDRERLVLTSPTGNGTGPDVEITQPTRGRDTTVSAGGTMQILGYAADPDGIDSVWFTLEGASFVIGPIHGNGDDTTFFNINLNAGELADTGTIRIFVSAVDQVSDTGQTKSVGVKVTP